MSEPRDRRIVCHLGTETAIEVVKHLPGCAEPGGTKIPLHGPKFEQGAMGLLVYPFQGLHSSAKGTPSRVVLRESPESFGSAQYRMAANPCYNTEILFSGPIHTEKGTRHTKNNIWRPTLHLWCNLHVHNHQNMPGTSPHWAVCPR